MSNIDELVAWLRAQIDEDEALAREAGGDSWVAVDLAFVDDPNGRQIVRDECMTPGVQAHIARHDPARVLREVEAKRGIVELHSDRDHFCGIGSIERDGYTWHEAGEKRRADIPCLTLRLLALPYADRPGYREEWRPS